MQLNVWFKGRDALVKYLANIQNSYGRYVNVGKVYTFYFLEKDRIVFRRCTLPHSGELYQPSEKFLAIVNDLGLLSEETLTIPRYHKHLRVVK